MYNNEERLPRVRSKSQYFFHNCSFFRAARCVIWRCKKLSSWGNHQPNCLNFGFVWAPGVQFWELRTQMIIPAWFLACFSSTSSFTVTCIWSPPRGCNICFLSKAHVNFGDQGGKVSETWSYQDHYYKFLVLPIAF